MTEKPRIRAIAHAAMKNADDRPELPNIRVGIKHVEPLVKAEMPDAPAGTIAAAVNDVFKELELQLSGKALWNGGKYHTIQGQRPYDFPDHSKIAEGRLAQLLGYALAGQGENLPEYVRQLIIDRATADEAIFEIFREDHPVQLDLLIEDFLS